MLDIDGFRIDKGAQVTVDALADFGEFIRQCARRFGKTNFFISGEITFGDNLGSIYLGRGRQPDQVPDNPGQAVSAANLSDSSFFLRNKDKNAFDAAAFHYSIYRSLTIFLGMEGNLTVAYDVPTNFVDAWNIMLATNDLVNANTGEFDPRHCMVLQIRMSFAGQQSRTEQKRCFSGCSSLLSICQEFLYYSGVRSKPFMSSTVPPTTIYMADKRCHRARPGIFMAVMGWGHFNTTTSLSIQHCMAAMMTRSAWITETRRIRFGISSSPCITLD
jgi:hypothetical protein